MSRDRAVFGCCLAPTCRAVGWATTECPGELLAALGNKANGVRELAQYLTNLAIEKGWSDDGIAYDALVKSWPRITELSLGPARDEGRLFNP